MVRKPLIDFKEEWVRVKGYEDFYAVSNHGRICSLERSEFVKSKRTNGHYRKRNARFLVTKVSKAGYEQVGLYKEGVCKRKLVHRLVAEAFLDNPLNLPEVNHKDLNKSNNKKDNLEWASRKGNLLHAEEHDKKRIGSSVGTSVLDEEQVLEIVKLLESGASQTEVAKIYGVTNHAIHRIAKGDNWSWLTKIGRKVGE